MQRGLRIATGACLLAGAAAHAELQVGMGYSGEDDPCEGSAISVVYSEVGDVSFFYSELAPHGAWFDVAPYGMVWQPAEVITDPLWRPYYCGGQWVWTSLGWYWNSSYAWGWAPFHYGRWMFMPDFRWVWIPDCAWGPAWVNWRYTSAHCGWAPLSPGATYHADAGCDGERGSFGYDRYCTDDSYVFVPSSHFTDADLTSCAVPRSRAREIARNSSAPSLPYEHNGDSVVNHGPPKEILRAALDNPRTVTPLVFRHKGRSAVLPHATSRTPAGESSVPMTAGMPPIVSPPRDAGRVSLAARPSSSPRRDLGIERPPASAPDPRNIAAPAPSSPGPGARALRETRSEPVARAVLPARPPVSHVRNMRVDLPPGDSSPPRPTPPPAGIAPDRPTQVPFFAPPEPVPGRRSGASGRAPRSIAAEPTLDTVGTQSSASVAVSPAPAPPRHAGSSPSSVSQASRRSGTGRDGRRGQP